MVKVYHTIASNLVAGLKSSMECSTPSDACIAQRILKLEELIQLFAVKGAKRHI